MRRILLLLTLLLATYLYARQNVVLGVSGGTTSGSMRQEMAGVVKQLNTSSSIAVDVKVFPSHEELYAALAANKVDLAFLGAVKYARAHKELGAIPIVAEAPDVKAIIAVKPASPIAKVEELRGKSIAFGYEDSTTTYLIPLLLLSKHGLHQGDFKQTFVGHHPQDLVDAMLAGKFDACAMSDYTYSRNRDKVRVLEQSDRFPGPPIVARKALDPAVVAEVRRLFLAYKPGPDAASQHFGKGAIPVTDADFNRVRFLMKSLFNRYY